MTIQAIYANQPSFGLFIDFNTGNNLIMGNRTCKSENIVTEINYIIGDRKNIFIHGSNSNSLSTFTNAERRGELLSAAHQRELGISMCCGDKVRSSFRFENGEREHERVFAFKYDTQSFKLSEEAVGETALYCGYGTEQGEAFPVIYVFSDSAQRMEHAQHIEFMTPRACSISPEEILGVMVPVEYSHDVRSLLSSEFPHITIRPFEWS